MSRDDLDAVGALTEPTRRSLYDFVIDRHDWVSREEAAAALGLRVGITGHHLDRLVADGLLVRDRQRRNGRSGPGAGRPANVYRRAPETFDVSLPPRRYDLAGRILSAAADLARTSDVALDDAIADAATGEGERIGQAARRRAPMSAPASDGTGRGAGGGESPRAQALLAELRDEGFEPVTGPDGVTVLHNCPFHELAQDHTELICGMNHAMLDAAVTGCGDTGLVACLEPAPGACCVRFAKLDDSPTP